MMQNILASSPIGETIVEWIEIASRGIELLAVVIIVIAICIATGRYFYRVVSKKEMDDRYDDLRRSLGRSLLVGLEVLVAADIVRTVALDMTLQGVVSLGILVLIRTFLSWALEVEIDGRWPWQAEQKE